MKLNCEWINLMNTPGLLLLFGFTIWPLCFCLCEYISLLTERLDKDMVKRRHFDI